MKGSHFFHLIKFLLRIERPDSQTTYNERAAIEKYAHGKTSTVEIGVLEGLTTAIIANSISGSGVLYAIDPFVKGRLGISYCKLIAFLYLKRKKVLPKVKFIEKFSHEGASLVPRKLDFIFVDGDHSWEGIKQDWLLFSPLLIKGGILALHDTAAPPHQSWKEKMDSVRFFNEIIRLSPEYKLIETIDSLNILQKI